MKSNFEFLNKYWPVLAQLGANAENYLYSDPNSWPFEYHFVEKLPTTGAGKIDFRTLEKWAENSDSF